MENLNNLVEELKASPEYYVRLLIKLREQVATLTILNQELQVAIDMESARSVELKNKLDSLPQSQKKNT